MIKFIEIEPNLKERIKLILMLIFKRAVRIDSPYLYVEETKDE